MSLYFTREGTGDNIGFFLHGLWGGGNYFRQLPLDALPFNNNYFPDELGFGKSPKPDIDYALETHAKYLAELIPENQKVTIIGHSFGTVLAVTLAALYPDKVKRLVLISPVLYQSANEAKQFLSTVMICRLMIRQPILAKLICKSACSTGILGMVSPWFVRGRKRKHISDCAEHTWHSYYSTLMNSILNEKRFSYAKSTVRTIPTLAIYGEKDSYLSPQSIDTLKKAGLQTISFPDEAHDLLFKNYDRTIGVIADWLAKP